MSLTLTWSENFYKQKSKATRDAVPTAETFKITDTKLYVPVVSLSIQDDNKFEQLEQLKTGFKRTIKWNKYRSELSN